MDDSLLKPMEPVSWLREATRLSAAGTGLADIVAALRRQGHSDLAIAFAIAALRSDAFRRSRLRPLPEGPSARARIVDGGR